MSDDLVKRLKIKSGVMKMGERIEWGSDTAIMDEAADRIEALEARIAAADALVEAMDCTALITQALENGAFSDPYAWAFEDALSEQCEALAAYRKTQEGEQ